MQAKLEPSELAYLLHMLRAAKVVGVNNTQLFPDDPATRDALLASGFAKLQEHEWFIAEESGINANNQLMLMAAVIVEPRATLMVSHYLSSTLRQTLTYYLREDVIVEQFVAPDGDYVLGRVATIDALVDRVREMFTPLLTVVPAQKRFTVAADGLDAGMAQAQAGDASALQQALLTDELPPAERAAIADTLRQLSPVGRIEAAVIAGQQLQAWSELAILRAPDQAMWLVHHADAAATIEFVPATDDQFGQMLAALLKLLQLDAI